MIRVRLSLQFPALDAGVRSLLKADPEIVFEEDSVQGRNETTADVHIMTSAVFLRDVDVEEQSEEPAGLLVLGAETLDLTRLWARGGGWGVLPMEVTSTMLRAAVHAVACGLTVGDPQYLASGRGDKQARGPLTEREVEILGMLSKGMANKQVAAALGISEHTVKFHVSSIYTKLNVANRTEAVREGLRNGWIAL